MYYWFVKFQLLQRIKTWGICVWRQKKWPCLPKKFSFSFLPRGDESNGKKRGTCFEGSSSASDLPPVQSWKMGLPEDPLLEKGIKWGLDWGWGLPWRHIHLQLRCTVVCFKTFSLQNSKKIQTEKKYRKHACNIFFHLLSFPNIWVLYLG